MNQTCPRCGNLVELEECGFVYYYFKNIGIPEFDSVCKDCHDLAHKELLPCCVGLAFINQDTKRLQIYEKEFSFPEQFIQFVVQSTEIFFEEVTNGSQLKGWYSNNPKNIGLFVEGWDDRFNHPS